ncbi:MAG: hypothetical protein C4582_11935 [Desulfobacteraceae bacterium]|nr:MAG: hypothetical protein C4582_11935 [Desulfobacteraceae bacterium]
MLEIDINRINVCLEKFVSWLDDYGETSYDHQSFFAGTLGGRAKALYYRKPQLGIFAVAPMVFSEAFMPAFRALFWHRQRLPIADAHYAMGFAYLYNITRKEEFYKRAVHFLEILEQTRCSRFENYCWGYPFDWETRSGTIKTHTPLITTTPYAYEAFAELYRIDGNKKWLMVLQSIAEHALQDIKDFPFSATAKTCSYTPYDKGGVVNASAYRAFLLTRAYDLFGNSRFKEAAEGNLNFVFETQKANGSWPYSIDEERDFIDHFHTCFVLKALSKIEKLSKNQRCTRAIEKGIKYYLEDLFDEQGLPKPFSRAPRLTVYRHELYDYAECINLGILLRGRFEELDSTLVRVVEDVLSRWKKPDGSFRSRKLLIGWDNVPMHRWAQSQMFRSLALLLLSRSVNSDI